jgi:hypothetical protein
MRLFNITIRLLKKMKIKKIKKVEFLEKKRLPNPYPLKSINPLIKRSKT